MSGPRITRGPDEPDNSPDHAPGPRTAETGPGSVIWPDATTPASSVHYLPRRAIEKPSNAHVPVQADACLRAIEAAGLASAISICGGFGLLHYLDHRPTRDVDAWWNNVPTDVRKQVIDTLRVALEIFGPVRIRTIKDTVSVELLRKGTEHQSSSKKVFSFQIGSRSAQLDTSVTLPWTSVPLDSLADIVASKTTALINRGAPRDFLDIYTACAFGCCTPSDCWRLWERRQEMGGEEANHSTARLAIETHLASIEAYRPLNTIPEGPERERAITIRSWFRDVFCAIE